MNFAQTKNSAPAFKGLVTACIAALALLAVGCSAGSEYPTRATGSGWPVTEVAAQIEPSVVQVNVEAIRTTPTGPEEDEGLGSGVIYREDGHIITNNHVVEAADRVNVAFADGSVEEGQVVGTDPFTDLAVIKVERDDLSAADFAERPALKPGDLAVAVGAPFGLQSTVTAGVISGLNREVPPAVTGGQQRVALVGLIQTDAPVSPGNSGGALANENGEVVGINVAYLSPGRVGAVNIGFAIPSETAIPVAEQLIENGEAIHPYLGVYPANLTPEIAERFDIPVVSGVLVAEVEPNSPAEEAGIERESLITAVGSEKIETTGELLASLQEYQPGDRINLTVVEGDDKREVAVELGERS